MKIMNKKAGFTLLELLTVMTIIGIISAVTLVSYLSMQSGSKYLSLARSIQNQAMLARQQAMLQNRQMCLLFTDNNGIHEVAVCAHAGTVTDKKSTLSPPRILNAFADPPTSTNAITLYSFKTGRRYDDVLQIGNNVIESRSGGLAGNYTIPSLAYAFNGANDFNMGDAYGFLVAQPYRLPKNIIFKKNDPIDQGKPLVIYFDSNGVMSQERRNNNTTAVGNSGVEFKIQETIRKGDIKVKISNAGIVDINWN